MRRIGCSGRRHDQRNGRDDERRRRTASRRLRLAGHAANLRDAADDRCRRRTARSTMGQTDCAAGQGRDASIPRTLDRSIARAPDLPVRPEPRNGVVAPASARSRGKCSPRPSRSAKQASRGAAGRSRLPGAGALTPSHPFWSIGNIAAVLWFPLIPGGATDGGGPCVGGVPRSGSSRGVAAQRTCQTARSPIVNSHRSRRYPRNGFAS